MHVKYASRHVLYVVPYAPVSVAVVVVARAGCVDTERVCLAVARVACAVPRADVVGVVAVRALVAGCCAVRVMVARVDVARGNTDVRDVVRETVTESDDWRAVFVFDVLRVMEFAPRTAASAVPILMKNAMIKYNAFLILGTINIMLSKKRKSDKGYSGKKNK
ncbi:MAG: hypothetical protein E7006_02445 [Alphaproteobacteria bacterium]|nr:hypothetical protein [Alphaproteobacteria bacterium]